MNGFKMDTIDLSICKRVYPVLTLYQPWATFIADGLKTIETRTHNRFTSLYGKTILIHAGQQTRWGFAFVGDFQH